MDKIVFWVDLLICVASAPKQLLFMKCSVRKEVWEPLGYGINFV